MPRQTALPWQKAAPPGPGTCGPRCREQAGGSSPETQSGSEAERIRGPSAAPVVIRQYRGERAVIDGASSDKDTWIVAGEYSTFWGLEFTNSNPRRVSISTADRIRPDVVVNDAAHTKFINLIVHDGGDGLYTYAEYPDVEIAGCIFY